jgi:glycosyltransferase involved in cell wall biosynthesis
MRYLEMGRALSEDLDVTLAIPNQTTISVPGIIFTEYHEERPESLKKLVDNSDVVLISSNLLDRYPFLWRTQARVVVDFYDPFVLENLHYYVDEPFESQESLNKQSVDFTNQLARIGDFYICGNDRQRDYWLGVLTANGRVNPVNFKKDPSLRELIDVVGMGFPNRKPQPNNLFRGIHPLIPAEARIVLWGGGIWDWLDPLTLIKAWPKVVHEYPEARLILLGTRHPNPNIPRHKMVTQAQTLAEEIGEKDKSIIFFEWLSYQDREALLCDADIGITLHPVHIETRYSIRTRILDYLWAQIPIVVTDGDITSEWVRQFKIGEVVPQFDVEAVARALISILSKPKDSWAPAFEPLGERFSWSRVVSPLRKYCSQGSYAPDREYRQEIKENQVSTNKWRVRWARARFILRAEGWRSLSHRTWRYLQWRLANRF